MIHQGKYVLRKGKNSDRSASGYTVIPSRPPEFVLEFEGVQIGAAHGGFCRITQIEIFEDRAKRGIGHGTKFVELWELNVKEKCKELTVSPVTVPNLAHILKDKCGFRLVHEDAQGAKTFVKDC